MYVAPVMSLLLGDIDKNELLVILQSEEWIEELRKVTDPDRKIRIIWAAADLAKERKIHEAMKIARFYQLDKNPVTHDEFDEQTRKGEDARIITTVRGTLPWLLQHIVASLETAYYSEILDILEGKADDTQEEKKLRLATGENLYVRKQASIALEILAANMKATKNADETPFDFGAENRLRTERLIFRMLDENRDCPRVLEYLSFVFNRVRFLDEAKAKIVLNTFFYNSKNELNPYYVTERIASLAIYFAEFREMGIKDSFNSYWFKSFLKKIIQEADRDLKTTIMWHFWKTCKDEIKFFEKIRGYIPLFFEGEPQYEFLNQVDFLIETIVDNYPSDAIKILEKATILFKKGVRSGAIKSHDGFHFYFSKDVVEKLRKTDPEVLSAVQRNLVDIMAAGINLYELGALLQDPKPNHDEPRLS